MVKKLKSKRKAKKMHVDLPAGTALTVRALPSVKRLKKGKKGVKPVARNETYCDQGDPC